MAGPGGRQPSARASAVAGVGTTATVRPDPTAATAATTATPVVTADATQSAGTASTSPTATSPSTVTATATPTELPRFCNVWFMPEPAGTSSTGSSPSVTANIEPHRSPEPSPITMIATSHAPVS